MAGYLAERYGWLVLFRGSRRAGARCGFGGAGVPSGDAGQVASNVAACQAASGSRQADRQGAVMDSGIFITR